MPAADKDLESPPVGPSGYSELPFPPLKKQHILHCSVHYWYPKYRAVTPKARLIPLTDAFVEYLKADGIVLPPDDAELVDDEVEFESDIPVNLKPENADDESDSDDDDEAQSADADPSLSWPEVHQAVKEAISNFGKVAPKLNWSAPKDSTWINPTNSMECRSANDVYLMLKSSDFVTHDLEHWDDDCVSENSEDLESDYGASGEDTHSRVLQTPNPSNGSMPSTIENPAPHRSQLIYALFLRKFVQVNPSVEFRVFVRHRQIIGICQRDVNHFDFLFDMVPQLRCLIEDFFEAKLQRTFPEENFVFDVYTPAPHQRVWLIDVNPWAVRTDPLLFSWLELLTMEGPRGPGEVEEAFEQLEIAQSGENEDSDTFIRVPFVPRGQDTPAAVEDDFENVFVPEFRLIKKDDPEAYSFNTPQYSAHKLPKDVVEASQSGSGPLREFAEQWKEMLAMEQQR